jgi:hypothetical protein
MLVEKCIFVNLLVALTVPLDPDIPQNEPYYEYDAMCEIGFAFEIAVRISRTSLPGSFSFV